MYSSSFATAASACFSSISALARHARSSRRVSLSSARISDWICRSRSAWALRTQAAISAARSAGASHGHDRDATDDEQLFRALVLGVRDYVDKNGFPGVLLGLSGGIDSALTLAIAVDALGADKVHAVMMPSRYTADISVIDAEQQARVKDEQKALREKLVPWCQDAGLYAGVPE